MSPMKKKNQRSTKEVYNESPLWITKKYTIVEDFSYIMAVVPL